MYSLKSTNIGTDDNDKPAVDDSDKQLEATNCSHEKHTKECVFTGLFIFVTYNPVYNPFYIHQSHMFLC